ncbi:ExbD/TolR family protein [Chitinivibrio alkaliphilus]|uniref:Biopolymer transport protein ExbD/TolR n=1 Tax=Chitinivibrio alkaliphilus ACht1 TaxID=1313304 RepID=U7D7E7_9BACT|nr:biopolymer transporter ExbD [Chitinivibrio alkaliphilus]ERP31848.1 Biopolymer transport protein ExbD/TolR [Chitinivibrio alkaliphilus ACht1]
MKRTGISQARTAPAGAGGAFRPQLTSLIDVMVILLVFLLKNFSVDGQLITPDPKISLPQSTTDAELHPALNIHIRPDMILVEQEPVMSIEKTGAEEELLLADLYDELRDRREEGLLIHADRTIPFEIIKKVMHTSSKAGVEHFSILVEQVE